MKVFEAVKKGFKSANGLLKIAAIFFAYNAITGLVSLPLANPERAGDVWVIAVAIVLASISFAVFVFLQGGAMGVIKDMIKTGKADLSRFNHYGKKFYLRILLLLLAYLLIGIFVFLILTLIQGTTSLLGGNAVLSFLSLTGITLLALAAVVLLVYPLYTIVVEDISVLEALKKGIKVSKDNYMRTLGLFLLLLIASFIISLLVAFIGTLIAAPFPMAAGNVIVTVANAVAQSYIPIVMMVAFMSFYMSLTSAVDTEEITETDADNEEPYHSEEA